MPYLNAWTAQPQKVTYSINTEIRDPHAYRSDLRLKNFFRESDDLKKGSERIFNISLPKKDS